MKAMRGPTGFLFGAVLALVVLFPGSPVTNAGAQKGTASSKGNTEQRFLYHDDDDGRIIAEVKIRLTGTGSAASVQLVISAVGPNVEPIAGYQGVRGANLFTAQQLELMLSGKVAVQVLTQPAGTNRVLAGTVTAGRRGTIPTRALALDGRVDFLAHTPVAYPLEVVVNTGKIEPGPHCTQLFFNGKPRLQLTYDVTAAGLKVTGFLGLGDPRNQPQPKAAPPQFVALKALPVQPTPQPQAKEKPLPPPVTDAEWNARDNDGKWSLYAKSVADNSPDTMKAWQQYLAKRQDFSFLEMVALYGDDHRERNAAGLILAKANAPQWLRVAVWLRKAYPSGDHGPTVAERLIHEHAPAETLTWLKKYGFDKDKGIIGMDVARLEKKKLPMADVSKLLPPLEPKEVLKHLDSAAQLEDFGDRKKAEPGKVYVQQVQRAMQGVVAAGLLQEPWTGKVVQLTRHANLKVRQSAYLTFTRFGASMEPKTQPLDEFAAVVDNTKEPPAIREAALLAYSYCQHPKVFLKLHHLALQTDHPAWAAAISRLADIGTDFTLLQLKQVPLDKLSMKDQKLLLHSQVVINDWIVNRQDNSLRNVVTRWLEVAAWAEHTNDPLRMKLTNWTKEFFSNVGGFEVEQELQMLQNNYVPDFQVTGDAVAYRNRVQKLAAAILMARKKQTK